MNIRQTITEENLNKSVARNWIITGVRIVMDFNLTSAEIKIKDYDLEETRRSVVAVSRYG